MKGQFFLLGAFLICLLFFLGLPSSNFLFQSTSEDLYYISKNIEKEIPLALNLGLRDNKTVYTLLDFTNLISKTANEHFINFSCIWFIGSGDSNTFNITVGNFLNHTVTVRLNLSGTEEELTVNHNSTNSSVFSSVPVKFNITVTFDNSEKILAWQINKTNLYSKFALIRGEDEIVEHITA